jgi:hypothetical protein
MHDLLKGPIKVLRVFGRLYFARRFQETLVALGIGVWVVVLVRACAAWGES